MMRVFAVSGDCPDATMVTAGLVLAAISLSLPFDGIRGEFPRASELTL